MVSTALAAPAMVSVVMVDTSTVVIAALLGTTGVVLLAAAWLRLIPAFSFELTTDDAPARGFSSGPSLAQQMAIRTACASAGLIAGYMVTGWPVLAGFMAVGGWFTLTLRNAKRERHAAIDRVDAIATWVENIRDNISGSAGLQQALRMSGEHAPAPIRAEVRDLILRMQHEPVTKALRRFAADVAHPTSDMAVACLILASSRAAGSLASVLAKTAQAARDNAAMMRQVDAGRAASLAQAKLVAIVTGLVSLMMTVTRPEFVAPYDSFGGQIALFIVCGLFAVAGFILYQNAKPAEADRVFEGVQSITAEAVLDSAEEAEAL